MKLGRGRAANFFSDTGCMSDIALETPRRRPRFTRADTPPPFRITKRDIEIVRQVARHRFLRSTHISQLLDAPHKKILERLSPLYHLGYLDRPRAQLEYHVRGGGSAPLVYALGNRGAQLLLARDGCGNPKIDCGHKNRQSGREFILHTLAVADVRVALTVACRKHGDITLQHAHQLIDTLPAETRATPNPWSWRVKVQYMGNLTEVGVLPDCVFALILPDGRRRAFFVECDRGTMPVARSTLDQTVDAAEIPRLREYLQEWSPHQPLRVESVPHARRHCKPRSRCQYVRTHRAHARAQGLFTLPLRRSREAVAVRYSWTGLGGRDGQEAIAHLVLFYLLCSRPSSASP